MEPLYIENISKNNIKPGLYIVSTPIGNLEDITLRAIKILQKSDLILCEDTRVSSNLLKRYKIKKTLWSYHKFNEKKILESIFERLKKREVLTLISDAGTPIISDPGLLLIKKCINNKIPIFPIPGPSAVTSAISVSGFSDKYLFYGFLPNTDSEIKKELKDLSQFAHSIVFFVSPKKINKVLKHMKIYFNGREIMIGREITKYYEEFIRSSIKSLNLPLEKIKGEITVVISDIINKNNKIKNLNELIKKEIKIMLKTYSSKDTANFISKKENISKKLIYEYCLLLRK